MWDKIGKGADADHAGRIDALMMVLRVWSDNQQPDHPHCFVARHQHPSIQKNTFHNTDYNKDCNQASLIQTSQVIVGPASLIKRCARYPHQLSTLAEHVLIANFQQ